jgi:outer membrane receptor protein involved in Fe transport
MHVSSGSAWRAQKKAPMQTRVNSIIIFLALLLIHRAAVAQTTISGTVKNNQQNLSSASVFLLSTDSIAIKGTQTDSAGHYTIADVRSGTYIISATLIGFTKYFSLPVILTDENVVLPDIVLNEESIEMNEVTVRGKKPVYEQKIDRLVMNVQSIITAGGGSVLEVLQKSPGVTVNKQNNLITMNGKSGVKVMINGKMLEMPFESVIQMLDGMTAANVEKIELITAPPAKYDAEGSGGIIHIVTKQQTELGTNASIGLTVGRRAANAVGGNFNISHRNNNVAYFLDYSISSNDNEHKFNLTRSSRNNGSVNTIMDHSDRPNLTIQQNISAGVEWYINKSTALNFGITGYRRNWTLDALNTDVSKTDNRTPVTTNIAIHEDNIWQSATGAIGLTKKLGDKSNIGVNVDYLYYNNDNPSQYDNKLPADHSVDAITKINLEKETPIKMLVGRLDYQLNFSRRLSLEAGVKGVTSVLDNNVLVKNEINNKSVIDSFFTSSSTLHEHITAAYVSSQWNAGDNWHVNAGVRYEYTHTDIGSPSQKNLVNRKYGYFFPSLTVKRDLEKNMDLQFAYSRRITRPTYNEMAPYVFFWGPNTFSSGNTTLRPSITDGVKLGFHLKRWMISADASHTKDEMAAYQATPDSVTNNLTYRSENLKYLNSIGVTNSYSFNVTQWWKVQANVTGRYQKIEATHLARNVISSKIDWNVNVVNAIVLPKDFALEVSGAYQSKSLFGISNFLPRGSVNAGVQKKFGERGTLRFVVDDIFNTDAWNIKAYSPENNVDTYFKYNFHNRFARLTYTRNLGNLKLKSVKIKSGSEEERSRVN